MSVAVLVPFTSGCEYRTRAWEFVRRHYDEHHPDWEVLVGRCNGTWSKGEALAEAASRTPAEIFVLADADSFIDPPETLSEAVRLVAEGAAWVSPHLRVQRISRMFTAAVLAGNAPRYGKTCRQPYIGVLGGGLVVLNRTSWESVGGVDPRFEGWGGEDISFGWALETLLGPPVRLDADLWHLWHPHPAPQRRGSPASEALAGRYRDARGNPAAMRALIDEEARP